MPPRPTPPPAGPNRRRPAPVMPNSWIWLVLLITLVVSMVVFYTPDGKQIAYSDFEHLVETGKVAKVTIKGDHTVVGELNKDVSDKELKELNINTQDRKFQTRLPKTTDLAKLAGEWMKQDP